MTPLNLNPDSKFLISFGAAMSVIVAAAVAVHQVTRTLNSIDSRLAAVESTLKGTYSKADAAEYALRMAIKNPGFRVPDPRDPNIVIEVKSARVAPTGATRNNGDNP